MYGDIWVNVGGRDSARNGGFDLFVLASSENRQVGEEGHSGVEWYVRATGPQHRRIHRDSNTGYL